MGGTLKLIHYNCDVLIMVLSLLCIAFNLDTIFRSQPYCGSPATDRIVVLKQNNTNHDKLTIIVD